jgi:hypothetical protein
MEKVTDAPLEDFAVFGWTHSFPVLIAQQLGYEPENWAIPGGSNDAMFRIFTEQLPGLTAEDIVIACWTGPSRTEIWHDVDQRWLGFAPGTQHFNPTKPSLYARSGQPVGGNISLAEEYLDYHAQWSRFHCNDRSDQLNKVKNIQALNAMAQASGIGVINIDSFAPAKNVSNINWAIDHPFFDWAVSNQFSRTDWGHFFLPAHQAYADLVVANLTAHFNTV